MLSTSGLRSRTWPSRGEGDGRRLGDDESANVCTAAGSAAKELGVLGSIEQPLLPVRPDDVAAFLAAANEAADDLMESLRD